MKTKILYSFLIISALIIHFSCKNPLNELSDFRLIVNGSIAESKQRITLKSTDSSYFLDPSSTSLFVTGVDAHLVYDKNGERKYPVNEDGSIDFILSSKANPTNQNPLIFTVNISSSNHLPLREDIYIYSKNESNNILYLENINKPKPGTEITSKEESFNYKKKGGPTEFKRSFNNLDITFTYPEGTVFIKQSNFISYFTRYSCWNEASKWSSWVYEGKTYSYPIEFKNQVCGDVKYSSYSTTLDEIQPAQVVATVTYSSDEDYRTQFYDENGILQKKPIIFDGKLNANIYFSLPPGQCAGNLGCNVYPKIPEGKRLKITYTLKNNSAADWLLYRSGKIYNDSIKGFINIFNVSSAASLGITQKGSDVEIVAESEASYGETFIFKKLIDGCGFLPVKINLTGTIPANSGYFVPINLSLFKPTVNGPMLWRSENSTLDLENGGNNQYQFIVPAFRSFDYKADISLNHYEELAFKRAPLFKKSFDINNICNNLNGLSLNFNESHSYPDQVWVDVEGTVFCDLNDTAANSTKMNPTLRILYKRADATNKNDYGTVWLSNGKLSTHVFKMNASYTFGTFNNYGTYVTGAQPLVFNPSIPEQIITQQEGYFIAYLKYNPVTNRFKLTVNLDNQKIKFNISGCTLK
jgi:hypothetical protein